MAPIRIRYLLVVTIALGMIFFSLTYYGIRQARQSLLNIMIDEGRALAEALAVSSGNAIQAGLLLESISEEKLADLSEKALRQLDTADPEKFRIFIEDHNLISIDILDSNLFVVGSNRWAAGYDPDYPAAVLAEAFDIIKTGSGYKSIMSYVEDDYSSPIQYFLFYNQPKERIVVLVSAADYMNRIMEQIGIGYLIREISAQPAIEYIILQSRQGIIFSSRTLPPLLNIESDPFLESMMQTDTIGYRMHFFDGTEMLEIARRFASTSYPEGVYRLGLNLDEFHAVSRGYDRQIIVIAVILFLLTLLVVAVVSINQNYFILDQSYKKMQSATETIFDQLSSAVLAYDRDGLITAANKAFSSITGVGSEAVGQTVTSLADKIPFALPGRIDSNNSLIGHEQMITTPSGEKITVLLGLSPLPPNAGGGAVLLAHDITEQKKLEEGNRRRERLSEMGDMAAGVAHEIRNPLNAIAIASQRLEREFKPTDMDEEFKGLTGNILEETNRLNQILTRFLDLAKSRGMEEKSICVNDAIAKGIQSISGEAGERAVEIKFHQTEKINVRGSLERLQQLFINLLRNSLQAMPDGGEIVISLSSDAHKQVMITVIDSGTGFPPDVMPKIFQPYFTTKTDGSGLGLALAYKTITDSGGTISASNDSSTGGAKIEITLPVG